MSFAREVVAPRRLPIANARELSAFAKEYFERVRGRVVKAPASEFVRLGQLGLLHVADARRAAAQLVYLMVGELGATPAKVQLAACAGEGVEKFMTRYGAVCGGQGGSG